MEAEPQALESLIHMIRNRGELVSKDALHETFWPGRVVSDAALSTLVRNARRLVGDSGDKQQIIATRHGRGFLFRAEVRELEGPHIVLEAMRDALQASKSRVEGAPSGMVLPFEIVSATSDPKGLSEGVTEEVIAALVLVSSGCRNRARAFLELPTEICQPFGKFGASFAVEGGILRDGDDIRLHAQFTNTKPHDHWYNTLSVTKQSEGRSFLVSTGTPDPKFMGVRFGLHDKGQTFVPPAGFLH
ncbi:MAG: winged helix-turn-helix domain-containing protein [Pseudomonadota bacterium]